MLLGYRSRTTRPPGGGAPGESTPRAGAYDWGRMSAAASLAAGVVATLFCVDLVRRYRASPSPHTAAYAAGIGFFALATWALFVGTATGWTSASYRTFFLFGAIVNIPVLALGSMFLVVGRRAGHTMLLLMFPFFAIALPTTLAQPFDAGELPPGGVPSARDLWADMFGPRLWSVIGGRLGGAIIILLALVSLARFLRKNPRLVWGNLAIVAGTLAAATGGTILALGLDWGFAVSLLVAVTFIWAGYRIASGARRPPPATAEDGAQSVRRE